jgi:hypothetical protein
MTHDSQALSPDLHSLMREIVPPGGRFGHRQHIHLAFLATRAFGSTEAASRMSAWIRQIATYQNAPQKYNATVTRAWTELVGYHAEADPAASDFDAFAARYPALLDKRLLSRHYRSSTLASPAARTGWVEPDLAPFPWQSRSARASASDER